MSITTAPFGVLPDGAAVDRYILCGAGGLRAEIIPFGCRIVRIYAPDRNGVSANVILGHDTLEEYEKIGDYQGAVCGRYANRISGAAFSIDGKTYTLEKNDGENSLHGGPTGFSYRLWNVKDASETAEGPSVTFSYESADGEEGFPGNLSVEVTYTVTNENDLRIAYRAKTDKATALNLTNHSFFNLSGDASKPIFHQELQINADAITAASDDLIPTGKLIPVAGTPYDFNEPKEIGRDMFADDHLLQVCGGYDHNFVLRGEGMRKAAEAYDKESGRVMEVYTDQPGMQLYTANSLSGAGVDGVPLVDHGAFCLETQVFPDSPHRPEFPFHYLQPGEAFATDTVYSFRTR